ncbi:peptidoglycan endopeptidase [Sphingomonas sp. 1P06PA]
MAERAGMLVGTRFRPGGRDPAHGLDCVGLAAAACGVEMVRAWGRSGPIEPIAAAMAAAGLRAIDLAAAGAGDVLLVRAGARHWHLIVRTESGFIHADALLGRVTAVPGPVPWPIAGAWRKGE